MVQDVDPAHHLALSGVLTVRRAEELLGLLRTAVAEHERLRVDCGAAEEVDLTFLQLLIAARTSARARGRQVTLSAPPAGALAEALGRAGFVPVREAAPAGEEFWFEGAAA
jgi:ABC-type transporter Mla MlaB component